MDKNEIAAILEEIGVLLELKGENRFRCLAYSKAARAISQLEESLADVIEEGHLRDIPNIGEVMADKITTLATTGQLPFYDDLKKGMSAGVINLLRIPALGPKKVKTLYEELGIDSLEKLKAACEAGAIADLKGFGKKTQDKILEGLAFLDQQSDRVRIDQGMAVADAVLARLKALPGVKRIEVCGSVRRRKETVKDIDLLISSDDPEPIMQAFVSLPMVNKVLGQGPTKSSVIVQGYDAHRRFFLQCDLRVVSDEQFPFALNYFTGSKEHNVAMRQRAIQHDLKLNEYELAGPSKTVKARSEKDIYEALGLQYVAPEMRESTGEIAAAEAKTLPTLVTYEDLHGVFHNHTNWSDGGATLEEMALAAKAMGWQYLGIADHSKSLTIANGLTPERVRAQQKEMDELNARLKGIHLFKGIECDILGDGSLDYDEDVLATFDYVVASVHSLFKQTEAEMTARIIKAIRHPRVTMLGHATGRLILRRDGYKVNLDAVLKAAAETGTMIEINANPHRLDLDWLHCKRAKSLGVKIVINPDAHAPEELGLTRYGIDVARRGWLEKGDVFNTLPLVQVKRSLAAGKPF
ncbi:MAG: DNA polymerase/3'-5' exonuclease PolX [Gemmataceae bacterium]|nr:DNA polymerase/3'-5' exonuclease PolX [Gemmataceae bacterium]